jgi:hypothetical protein
MRLPTMLVLMVACAAAPTVSAGAIVPWRTLAWHPARHAVAPAPPALRFDPEGQPASADLPDLPDLPAQIAARRAALARVPVLTRPDGSRHATLGGLAREYTVARIGADGTLTQTCVSSEAQAKRLVTPTGKER